MDIKQFEKLLEEGNIEQAGSLLKEYMKQPLTDEERGGLYVAFAAVYMKMKNEVSKQYLAELKEIGAALKGVTKTEQKVEDAIHLAEVRKGLSEDSQELSQ